MKDRFKYSSKLALIHFLISCLIAIFVAFIVYNFLYPTPYNEMLGISKIFLMLITIDVICGPLLTLLIANPKKSKRETLFDFIIIGTIQLVALGYGVASIYKARPIAEVFEFDRFVVVQANEVQEGDYKLPIFGINRMSIRDPVDANEKLKSIQLSMKGVPPSVTPSWWIDLDDTEKKRILDASMPISKLMSIYPDHIELIKNRITKTGIALDSLKYLPIVCSKTYNWTAIIDGNANTVAYLPLDAFRKPETE